jgi:DNA-binding NtrC family response regulator
MAQTKILVVEDDRNVTADIRNRLKILGYPIPTTASSGKEAMKKAAECHPDLVLIDIQLKGEVNGIKAAQQIHECYGIPVIYLMYDADEKILKDEKLIEPFCYLLKPCEEDSLHLSIERALYQHKMGKLWRHFNERKIAEGAS